MRLDYLKWFISVPLLLAAGCGYTWSDNGNSFAPQVAHASNGIYRQNVSTVAVPIFTNITYDRGLELSLTKAVISDLEAHTPYKVAPRDRADTILEGTIVYSGTNLLSRSPSNALPQEQLSLIIVNFTWKDLRNGQILTDRRSFQQSAPYYPTLGEDPYVGQQDNIEKLARAIVEELAAPWGKTAKSN
ncbi:MAG TPA: LPS assembly lipoprotein LptE [Tepidisphaeraceae bacterium]|jgi:hypothetical protein|nr:LPS assembly lipoprotein LptE [Tepidisphaeraceae bacterium]